MKSAAKVRILYMLTKKRRKNILGTMAEVDSVLPLPLFVSLVDIFKMPQTGQRKCLKLANKNASNWPTKMPQTSQRKCLKLANENASNWPIEKIILSFTKKYVILQFETKIKKNGRI